MEKIKLRYISLLKALDSLEEILELFTNLEQKDEKIFAVYRDSIIKRFEYTFDLFWKYVKLYLEKIEKIALERTSPRYIIQEALQNNIILQEEREILLDMLQSRNFTSHLYKEDIANLVCRKIKDNFYIVFENVLSRIKV
jgi:nucleotidyltransferase substrate binding protein (TIGR01987 family)